MAVRRAVIAKRMLDIVGAFVLLIVVSPLIAVCALIVALRTRSAPFYRQPREGRGGVVFQMVKVRTMHANSGEILERHLASSAEARAEWAKYRRFANDPRVIPGIGHGLRRTSLDELPQLWNVLMGDMSLVGPRPLELPVVASLSDEALRLRRSVRPGMTGLWQVSGRSEHDLSTLCAIDAEYVRQWSLWSDVQILLRTPAAVLSRRGAF